MTPKPDKIKGLATYPWLATVAMTLLLTGCLGGSIGQQIVQSILLQGADKATASAMDAHERNQIALAKKNAKPDPYTIAFLNSGFEPVTAQIEPLPEALPEEEKDLPMMQETKLVPVEIWSLLAGEEKQNVLEAARLRGSTEIPPKDEWRQWQIATGASNQSNQPITFLIPPEMGKMRSGAKAMVELSRSNELSVARYSLN
ncbi:MAG TPA: hypothetical protein PKL58_03100 [Methylophilaceae bacterium]|nr:hypothetical protein [Methylophilaceae bacterium]